MAKWAAVSSVSGSGVGAAVVGTDVVADFGEASG